MKVLLMQYREKIIDISVVSAFTFIFMKLIMNIWEVVHSIPLSSSQYLILSLILIFVFLLPLQGIAWRFIKQDPFIMETDRFWNNIKRGIIFVASFTVILVLGLLFLDILTFFGHSYIGLPNPYMDMKSFLFKLYAGVLLLIAFITTAFTSYARYLALKKSQEHFEHIQKQFKHIQEQFTDALDQKPIEEVERRFQKGINLLGNDQESVRLGGIYILWGIVKDALEALPYLEVKKNTPKVESFKKAYSLRSQIVNILCTHIRSRTNEKSYLKQYYPSLYAKRYPKAFVEDFGDVGQFNYLKPEDEKPSNEIQTVLSLLTKTNVCKTLDLSRNTLNLVYAILKGASCQAANFEGAYCRGVDFQNANLQQANFQKANLKNAHFQKAVCSDAYFDNANLENSNFKDAFCENSSFRDAFCGNSHFENAICENAHFEKALCNGSFFSGANCSSAHFEGANCRQAHFEKANCSGAHFTSACCNNASFEGANCINGHFEKADYVYARFGGAKLSETYFTLDENSLESYVFDGINAKLGSPGDFFGEIRKPAIIFLDKNSNELPLLEKDVNKWLKRFACLGLSMKNSWRISIHRVKYFLDLNISTKIEDFPEFDLLDAKTSNIIEMLQVKYKSIQDSMPEEFDAGVFWNMLSDEEKFLAKKYLSDFDRF